MINCVDYTLISRLLATENLAVVHDLSVGASFDTKNRILHLPTNVTNLSPQLAKLFISHEIGHALYTPAKGLCDVLKRYPSEHFKMCVNVLEDIRIEKMVQSRYPGLKMEFRKGYEQCVEDDFFGIKDASLSELALLDRINLHYKIGTYKLTYIPFRKDEREMVEEAGGCITFDDVVRVALKLWEQSSEDTKGEEGSEDSSGDSEKREEGSEDSSGDLEKREGGSENSSGDSEKREGGSENSSGDSEKREGGSDSNLGDRKPMDSSMGRTQKSYETCIDAQVEYRHNNYTRTCTLPPVGTANHIIVSYADILSQYQWNGRNRIEGCSEETADIPDIPTAWLSTNRATINYMAQIFEMKKKASEYSRTSLKKTGLLDPNKLYQYKYTEEIFKSKINTQTGKSHGLVMFMDFSSSMYGCLKDTLEQVLHLVYFCRKIQIPFRVYSFTKNPDALKSVKPVIPTNSEEIIYNNIALREFFSDKMTLAEFNKMVCCLQKRQAGFGPEADKLSTTPLVPAIIAATDISQQFKKMYQLENVHTIFLSDGDNTEGLMIGAKLDCIVKPRLRFKNREWTLKGNYLSWHEDLTTLALQVFKDITQTDPICIYLDGRKIKDGWIKRANYEGWTSHYTISKHALGINNHAFNDSVQGGSDFKESRKERATILKAHTKYMTANRNYRKFLNVLIENIS